MLPAYAITRWRRLLNQAVMLSAIAGFGVCNASPARSRADALFARGDFGGARIGYVRELARSPNDLQAILGLARVELYENQLDAAAESANKVLALDPDSAPAQRALEVIAQRRAILTSAMEVRVPRSGVKIPFLESEPLPLIEARIDGRTASLLLDTGAPDVILDPDFAREVGLTIAGGRERQFAGGRTAVVRQATVHSVVLGPITLHDLKVGILPTRGMHLYRSRVVDGIVGTVFLSRFLSTIDYPNHRLVVRPRAAKVSGGEPSTVVPMWLVGDHYIFVTGSVNDLDHQLLLVDSGGTGSGFSPLASTVVAARIPLTSPPEHGIGGGGAIRVIPVMVNRLCIGDACQQRVRGLYQPDGRPLRFPFRPAGTVTHLYLQHYRVTFDFARMKLVLEP
jgi:hypothetical protein